MTVVEWITLGIAVVCSTSAGWLIRHSILQRQLTQTRKQRDELQLIQLNTQHELVTLRKSNIESDSFKKRLSSQGSDMEACKSDLESCIKSFEELKEKHKTVELDVEDLNDQIAFLETERGALQEKNARLESRIESMDEETQRLKNQLEVAKSKEMLAASQQKEHELVAIGEPKSHSKRLSKREIEKLKKKVMMEVSTLNRKKRKQQKSTDRFASKSKRRKPDSDRIQKDILGSTGIRMLEEFEEELRNPDQKN